MTRCDYKDRIFPLTSFQKADDGWIAFGIRAFLAFCTFAYLLHLSTIPGLMGDITKAAMKAHDDAKSYGIDKIAFNFTNINKRSLTHEVFDVDVTDDPAEGDYHNKHDTPNEPEGEQVKAGTTDATTDTGAYSETL